jgi:hypothetical protein
MEGHGKSARRVHLQHRYRLERFNVPSAPPLRRERLCPQPRAVHGRRTRPGRRAHAETITPFKRSRERLRGTETNGRPEGLRYERGASPASAFTAWLCEPLIGKSCVGGVVASVRETSRAPATVGKRVRKRSSPGAADSPLPMGPACCPTDCWLSLAQPQAPGSRKHERWRTRLPREPSTDAGHDPADARIPRRLGSASEMPPARALRSRRTRWQA